MEKYTNTCNQLHVMLAGIHYADQTFLGGDLVWRNVTTTCADLDDLQAEVEVLENIQAAKLSALRTYCTRSDCVEGNGGLSAMWAIIPVTICGAFPELLLFRNVFVLNLMISTSVVRPACCFAAPYAPICCLEGGNTKIQN